MIKKLLVGFFLVTLQAFALEFNCKLKPNEINGYGTSIVEKVALKKMSLPEDIPLQTEFEADFDTKNGNKFYGTFEGFYRPSEDDFISLTELPVLGFDVSKERIVIYVCANYDPNPRKTHLTIYFLRGYHIDPTSFSNFWGDMIQKPHMKIRPVPASLLGISKIKKFFLRIFRFIPFSSNFFDTWSLLQRLIANSVGDITGFGVERIEATEEYFKLSSGVNLDSPRESIYKKTFKLKKPDLGPGTQGNNSAASSRSFANKNDQQVLNAVDNSKVLYEELSEEQDRALTNDK